VLTTPAGTAISASSPGPVSRSIAAVTTFGRDEIRSRLR
jgi:hypothetical protein